MDRPAGHPRASTGPGRTGQKRRSRRRTAIGAVFAIAALGFGADLVQSIGEDDSPPASASDTFSGVKLEKRVEDLLGKTESGSPRERDSFGTAASPTEGTKTFLTADVPDCIAKGIGDTTGAIASEPGTYRGTDAYLVLLPDRSDDSRVTAYVVDASCLKKASEPAGDVLVEHTYARP